jgi:hypothetical protein
MAAIDDVIGWLVEASRAIGEGYIRPPIAGADPKYRERNVM